MTPAMVIAQRGGGVTAAPRPAAPARPGLDVEITAVPSPARDHVRVDVQATSGEGPLRLYLYIDGDLVGAWGQAAASWESAGDDVAPGRHVATARVIDSRGRWGGASTVVEIAR